MFIVVLRFSDNKTDAGRFMDGHQEWIRHGFDDGVFLLAGGLKPDLGGVVLARDEPLAQLQTRVGADPFVAEGVVEAEILEVAPSRVDQRLSALLAGA